jgi:hypothetical protein
MIHPVSAEKPAANTEATPCSFAKIIFKDQR